MQRRRLARWLVLVSIVAGTPSVLAADAASPRRAALSGEARQRLLHRVVETGRLMPQLRARFGERVGPTFYADTPEGQVYAVGIVGRTDADERAVNEITGHPELVQVRTARYTLEQLVGFADRVGASMEEEGARGGAGIEVPLLPERVVVRTTTGLAEPVRQRLRSTVPVPVEFRTGPPLRLVHDTRIEYPPYEAGLRATMTLNTFPADPAWHLLSDCTSGFAAYSASTRRYYGTTAGHCGSQGWSIWLGDQNGIYRSEIAKNGYDDDDPVVSDSSIFQIAKKDVTADILRAVRTPTRASAHLTIRKVYTKAEVESLMGSTVCWVGMKTNAERCGPMTIRQARHRMDDLHDNAAWPLRSKVLLNVYCMYMGVGNGALGGDSGGPVYVKRDGGVHGLGMIVAGDMDEDDNGTQSDRACFQTLAALQTEMGVEIIYDGWVNPNTVPNGNSDNPMPSADGSVVAFESDASNLIADDGNGHQDVFVRDETVGQTLRVSVTSSGGEANSSSVLRAMTPDGRYVLFDSSATNLVASAPNGGTFLHDRTTGTTTVASIGPNAERWGWRESAGQDISPDGRYITLDHVGSEGYANVWVRDRLTNTTTLVSVNSAEQAGNNGSAVGTISDDGRYVAFTSHATNLVADDGNWDRDVFVRDRTLGTTVRVSVGTNGQEGNGPAEMFPEISGNGRYVVFASWAANLGTGDTNVYRDVFVRDLSANTTIRASVNSSEQQANHHSGGGWEDVHISADGRYVAFTSTASNLVFDDDNGVEDVFVRDLTLGTTTRVNVTNTEAPYTGSDPFADGVGLSTTGRWVTFTTDAKFSTTDANTYFDSYLRDRVGGTTTHISHTQ